MKVTPSSTAPVKGVSKAILTKHLGLDFADKVGPRASYGLQALCDVSDSILEGLSVDQSHTSGSQRYAKLDTLC
jgi:hypothetical protein